MKRFIFLLAIAIIFSISAFSQPLPEPTETGPDSLQGASATLTVYSGFIDGYWDVSTQIVSTFAGLGDSTNFTVATWQSNDRDRDVWTVLTALNDSIVTVTDETAILIEKTDFTGLWLKHVFTSRSLDTVLINTYQVKKKFRLF